MDCPDAISVLPKSMARHWVILAEDCSLHGQQVSRFARQAKRAEV